MNEQDFIDLLGKKYRYKSLKIARNALVPKGAMMVEAVFKEDGFIKKSKQQVLLKEDNEKFEMTAIMVLFNKFDSDNMILDDENLRDEVMIDFMENGEKKVVVTHNKEDNDREIEGFIKELFVVRENDPSFSDYYGSIAHTIKFRNAEDFEIAKELGLQTSFEGYGELEEIKKDLKEIILKNIEYFKKYIDESKLKEIFGEKMFGKQKKELEEKIQELQKELEELKSKEEEGQKENKDAENENESLRKELDEAVEVSIGLKKAFEEISKEFEELKKAFLERKTPELNGKEIITKEISAR